MDYTVEITALQLVSEDFSKWGKDTLLAYFSFIGSGFAVGGCALVRRKNGTCVMALPKLPGRDGRQRSISLTSTELRIGIVEAAVTAYRAIGGKSAGEVGAPIQTFSPRPEPEATSADEPVEDWNAGVSRWLENAG